ncbi:MAG: DUF4886 domain-containing protein [Verrucomicrobiia bacterium]|jgi:hypothetical protein
MKTRLSSFFARVVIVALTSLIWLAAGVAAEPETVRLLTVGNSFSRNATRYLGDLANAGGHKLIHRPIVVGGASLQLHAEKASSNGCYTNGRSLKQELAADRWDFVTIQQASIKSHDTTTYRPFAAQLHDYIKKHAPQAKLLVHQTWAYRCDDPRFTKPPTKPGEPATREAMYRLLTSAYRTITAELGARVIPVGDAFDLADSDPKWGYRPDAKFDLKNAKPPTLPDQTHSLHMGRQWKKQKNGKMMLGMDGHHANTAGEYLGACVFYEVLFNETVVGNAFVPPGILPAYARFLQETAHRAVTKSRASRSAQ